MSMAFGLQLFSVREELAKDYAGTLERIAEIGYRYVELAFHTADQELKVGGMTPSQLRDKLDRLGLKVVSAHMDPMEKFDWERVIAFNQELGNTAIGKGIAFFRNRQDVRELGAQLNRYGEICRKHGVELYYHNHFQEFQQFEGKYVLDHLLAYTDAELVKFELDLYWTLRGGVDPIAYLQRLGSRCDLLHLKDYPLHAGPINAFEQIGPDEVITLERFLPFSKPEYFSEIGEGTLDIENIVRGARALGHAKYLFVEQDQTDKNQLESVAISYRNISRLFLE